MKVTLALLGLILWPALTPADMYYAVPSKAAGYDCVEIKRGRTSDWPSNAIYVGVAAFALKGVRGEHLVIEELTNGVACVVQRPKNEIEEIDRLLAEESKASEAEGRCEEPTFQVLLEEIEKLRKALKMKPLSMETVKSRIREKARKKP